MLMEQEPGCSCEISLCVAVAEDGAFGHSNGAIPWHQVHARSAFAEDIAHFSSYTRNVGAVLMGRATWEALPVQKLPGRKCIVVSRTMSLDSDECEVYRTVDEALADYRQVCVIGGAALCEEMLDRASHARITLVRGAYPDAEVRAPVLAALLGARRLQYRMSQVYDCEKFTVLDIDMRETVYHIAKIPCTTEQHHLHIKWVLARWADCCSRAEAVRRAKQANHKDAFERWKQSFMDNITSSEFETLFTLGDAHILERVYFVGLPPLQKIKDALQLKNINVLN